MEPGLESVGKDWEAVRANAEIQFAPLPPPEPPRPPPWLEKLQELLAEWLGPAGEWLGNSWPTLKWVLLVLTVLLLAFLSWRILSPMLRWKPKGNEAAEEWAPDREDALALLEDADRLATEGRFDEATHLLLRRSVGQIRAVRPDWLEPSSTAREIVALPDLPSRARGAFATIAERVERSLFALRPLGREDWQAARTAYADFALSELAMEVTS